MNNTHLLYSARHALIASVLIGALGISTFFAFEPSVSRAITDDFTVTQTVGSEISFLTTAADVTMQGTLSGITGGVSSGTTTVVVLTNDSAGYNMTMSFASTTANPGVAMNGNTQGGYVGNYTPATPGTPDYTFSVAANAAEFAYTVNASTTADLDQTFLDNGAGTCGVGAVNTSESACWLNPTTSPTYAETIVNRNAETPSSGATTSIAFRLQITSNPSPAIPEDIYVATATLTALTN